MSLVIDNETGDILGSAIGKLRTVKEAREALDDRRHDVEEALDPRNAPWPSDGFPNMGARVRAMMRATPSERAELGRKAKQSQAWNMTTQEQRDWLSGQFETGG